MVGHGPLKPSILVRVQVPQHGAQRSAAGSKHGVLAAWTRRPFQDFPSFAKEKPKRCTAPVRSESKYFSTSEASEGFGF